MERNMGKQSLSWETIDDYHKRAKIHAGWLVKSFEDVFVSLREECRPEVGYEWRVSMCFVPDLTHEWELENSDESKYLQQVVV